MHAIIESGGKQYKVQAGDIITVEKLGVEAGESFTFDKVLGIIDGDATVLGKPLVEGASVTGSVLGDGKAKKVIIYKYKAKKGYHRKRGHRQPFTKVKIEAVNPA
ncbi:MAG: 50S ribosomal protein L21 [Defluviitaleaceae bacterium]|nr:50S ribosomal protein L21 [Defluviitaleaceae bacterium]